MTTPVRVVAFVAAILALSGLILAAMGSHVIEMNGMQDIWQVASNIHLFSAATLVGLAALLANQPSRFLHWGTWLIILGALVFCGSIYFHVVTGQAIRHLTPAGGFLMMAGWVSAALAFLRKT